MTTMLENFRAVRKFSLITPDADVSRQGAKLGTFISFILCVSAPLRELFRVRLRRSRAGLRKVDSSLPPSQNFLKHGY